MAVGLDKGTSWCFTESPKTTAMGTEKHRSVQAGVIPVGLDESGRLVSLGDSDLDLGLSTDDEICP